jgi:hypothetical protein
MPFLSFQVMTCIGQRQSVATAAFAKAALVLGTKQTISIERPRSALTPGGHLGWWIAGLAAGKRSEQSQNCSNQRYTQEQENGFQDPP